MDVLTKEQRQKNMRAIKSKGTKIEVLLGKALWARGIRYRKNNKTIFGKPDFAIKKYKIAIFCDSEYFHGKDWETNKLRIKTNTNFWHRKIEQNIKRDELVNRTLREEGWSIIRFWGEEIKKDIDNCIIKIERILQEKKSC